MNAVIARRAGQPMVAGALGVGLPRQRHSAAVSRRGVPVRGCVRFLRAGALSCWGLLRLSVVSFEVFKRSPQPLKAGIVATAVFRGFLEFSIYSQRCISAGSMAARSACDLFRPAASPYLSPCTLRWACW